MATWVASFLADAFSLLMSCHFVFLSMRALNSSAFEQVKVGFLMLKM